MQIERQGSLLVVSIEGIERLFCLDVGNGC